MLMHGEVGATSSSRQEIRQYVLNGYDKSTHPNNNVRLRFSIYYDYRDCPTLDPASGTLLSTVQEKQVRSASFFSLHWLKVNERIEYKLLSLTYKVLTTAQPSYLHNLISLQPPRSTCSSSVVTLSRPPTISSLKITDRSF